MEVKLNLSNTEHKDLLAYCNLNDLLISSVVKDSFTTGFNIERYGLLNAGIEEKQVVKEVIVEKRVEIPVETIKEVVKIEYVEVEKPVEVIREVTVEKVVEVTKEVPVEKVVIQEVVKEVVVEKVVEKIIKVSDDTQVNELLLKIQQLENTPPKVVEVIKEVEKIVEVPVEVVKEIIIEKEGDSNLKPKMDALQNTVQKLKLDNIEKDKLIKEYEKTIEDIQKFQNETKAMYLKGSNLDDKLYK
jgi:hypothetical protein